MEPKQSVLLMGSAQIVRLSLAPSRICKGRKQKDEFLSQEKCWVRRPFVSSFCLGINHVCVSYPSPLHQPPTESSFIRNVNGFPEISPLTPWDFHSSEQQVGLFFPHGGGWLFACFGFWFCSFLLWLLIFQKNISSSVGSVWIHCWVLNEIIFSPISIASFKIHCDVFDILPPYFSAEDGSASSEVMAQGGCAQCWLLWLLPFP